MKNETKPAKRTRGKLGRYSWKYTSGSRTNAFGSPMGRFGGGWNWKVGAQWSRRTVIVSLLVSELRIDIAPKGGTR